MPSMRWYIVRCKESGIEWAVRAYSCASARKKYGGPVASCWVAWPEDATLLKTLKEIGNVTT